MGPHEEITYAELFERHLTRVVEPLITKVIRNPDSREQLFGAFLEDHVFICSSCGDEFTAVETAETDLVRCKDCGSRQ